LKDFGVRLKGWFPSRGNERRIKLAFFDSQTSRGAEAQAKAMPDKKHARPKVPF